MAAGRPRCCRSSAATDRPALRAARVAPEKADHPPAPPGVLSGYARRCVIATKPTKNSKPSTAAAEPKSIVDQLRELVKSSEVDLSFRDDFDKIQKIAVSLVLWDKSAFLKTAGVKTDGSLKGKMDSACPLIGSAWCSAVMTVRYERWLRELKHYVERVERYEDPIDKLLPPLRGAVAAVLGPDDCFETLPIDEDLKRAIQSLRGSRAKWAAFYIRWEIDKPLQWQVADVLDYVNDDAGTAFNAVEKTARNKVPKAQLDLAKQLRVVRHKVLQISTELPKRAGTEIAELCRLLETVSSQLQSEGERHERLAQYYEMEFRGRNNNRRTAVIRALAPIYKDLTGKPADAKWSAVEQDRQTEFVRFVHDFFDAAGRPDWADGLEFAVNRRMPTTKN